MTKPEDDPPSPPFPTRTDLDLASLLGTQGEVFRNFLEQDSGCRSYGVNVRETRWFVKHGPTPLTAGYLRGALRLHASVRHPTIVSAVGQISSRDGLSVIYPWVDGEVLYHPPSGSPSRTDPSLPHARFRAQPVETIIGVLDAVFDAHLVLSKAGFVAVDLYDGCLLYDFERGRPWLIDLDHYHPGPFRLSVARLPGSTRFMPPEHSSRGALVDDRSTVFLLARMAQVLLDEGDLSGRWRASPALSHVAKRGAQASPDDRYPTTAAFVDAWRAAQ